MQCTAASSGIGDGVQPLISFYYGAKKEDKIHILYRSLFVTIAVSLILCIAVVLFLNPLTALFGISDAIFEGAKTAILITTVSFPFLGITRVTSAIFLCDRKNTKFHFSGLHGALLTIALKSVCFILPVSAERNLDGLPCSTADSLRNRPVYEKSPARTCRTAADTGTDAVLTRTAPELQTTECYICVLSVIQLLRCSTM